MLVLDNPKLDNKLLEDVENRKTKQNQISMHDEKSDLNKWSDKRRFRNDKK